MNKSLRNYFLHQYDNKPLMIQKKAAALVYLNLSCMVIFILIPPVVFFIDRGKFLEGSMVASLSVAGLIFDTLLLRTGRYRLAANFISVFITLIVAVGTALQFNRLPNGAFSSMIVLASVVIVFSSLISTWRWTSVLTFFIIVAEIVFYFYLCTLGVIDMAIALQGATMNIIAISVTYILSMVIFKTNIEAIRDIEKESKQNLEQYLKIKNFLQSVSDVSAKLAVSSEEMSGAALSFSDNTSNQASSIEEITAALGEVTSSMDQAVINVEDQFSSLNNLKDKLGQLSSLIDAMNGLIHKASSISDATSRQSIDGQNKLNTMSRTMNSIKESSNKMTGVADVIDQISDQISLLSLNAAIEAARAGDAGRGFAVVADEISKLADKASDSTKEISSLIISTDGEIDRGMINVVDTVEVIQKTIENINSITTGISQINDLMSDQVKMNGVVEENARTVMDKAEEIRFSINEQKAAIYEVSRSINAINESAQGIAAGSEEMSSTSEELSSLADELKRDMDIFSRNE